MADSTGTPRPTTLFANFIGAIVVFFLCATMGYLTYVVTNTDLPDKTLNIVIYILGFVTGKLSTVVDWSFGTSSVNKKQAETINTMAGTSAAAQAALPKLGEIQVVVAPVKPDDMDQETWDKLSPEEKKAKAKKK